MIKHISGVIAHRFWVSIFLISFGFRLFWRAVVHDLSKFSKIETKGFIKSTPKLKGLTYGSPEYKDALKELGPSLDHHYLKNKHHPEHFKHWLLGMELIDLVEMYYDWKASTKRHANGSIIKSVENNEVRFDLGDQLTNILMRTSGR